MLQIMLQLQRPPVTAVCMLHTKLHFGNCSHFSEREENVCLSISCLFQTIGALRKRIVDVIGSEYLTKDTAVSQNVSKTSAKSLNTTSTGCLRQQ